MADSSTLEQFLYAVLTQIRNIIGEDSWKAVVSRSLKDIGKYGLWESVEKVVAPSSIMALDTIPLANFSIIKYIISVRSSTDLRYEEMTIMRQGLALNEEVSNRSGNLNIRVNPNVNNENCELVLQNLSTQQIEVKLLRAIGI